MDSNAKAVLRSKREAIIKGEDAIQEQIAAGKDIMSILCTGVFLFSFPFFFSTVATINANIYMYRIVRANLQENEADRLPESQLLGLMNGLIFAAMDTTSSAFARMVHILALNPEIQDRLRHECLTILEQFGREELDYDTLSEMPYLDACCRETLRL